MNRMDRETWLKCRSQGLGGTDVAALCGLNPHKAPIDVYNGKRGLIGEDTQNAAMTWGLREEPIIAEHYADLHGVKLVEPGFMVHPSHSWIVGTPDRLIDKTKKGLEIKTANSRVAHLWGDDGTDEVPDAYLIQCEWYMILTGYPVWDLAVKIDSADYREYTIPENPALQKRLIEIAGDFWYNNILAGVPPEPDGSEQYVKYVQAAYPKDTGKMIAETPQLRELAMRYTIARTDFDVAAAKKEELENLIKSIIGEASGIEGDGWKATWKKTKDSVKTDYAIALDKLADHGVDPLVIKQVLTEARFTAPGYRRFYFKSSFEAESTGDRAA